MTKHRPVHKGVRILWWIALALASVIALIDKFVINALEPDIEPAPQVQEEEDYPPLEGEMYEAVYNSDTDCWHISDCQ